MNAARQDIGAQGYLASSGDTHETTGMVLGDVDGDGDIDLVVGNRNRPFGQANRLYLNNGTADPFAGRHPKPELRHRVPKRSMETSANSFVVTP